MNGGDDRIQEAAARWFASHKTGRFDAQGFARWRDADPAHALAFLRLVQAWDHLPSQEESRVVAPRIGRRVLVRGLAVCGVAGAMGIGLLAPRAEAEMVAQTAVGERRMVRLSDGSSVALSSNTRIHWRCDTERRSLTVERGEILLMAPKGPPFTVTCGDQRMLLDAGRYAVALRDTGMTQLMVIEGHSDVRQRHAVWNVFDGGTKVRVSEGHRLEASTDGTVDIQTLSPRQIDDDTAWLRGEIVFNDTSLAQAVTAFNRFLPRKLVLSRPEIGRLRVDGRFRLDDPGTFLQALRSGMDIAAEPIDGRLILSRKNI